MQQFNPNLNSVKAKINASNLISTTKGEKCWYLNEAGIDAAALADFEYDGEPLTKKKVDEY